MVTRVLLTNGCFFFLYRWKIRAGVLDDIYALYSRQKKRRMSVPIANLQLTAQTTCGTGAALNSKHDRLKGIIVTIDSHILQVYFMSTNQIQNNLKINWLC